MGVEAGKREVFFCNACDGLTRVHEGIGGAGDLLNLFRRELVNPAFRVVRVVFWPPYRLSLDAFGKGAVWLDVVV